MIRINATPKYPGDAIRQALLKRGDELGDVRIQWYANDSYHVAAFTPGYESCPPGDTPKMIPDHDEWCATAHRAEHEFNFRLARAHAEGWLDYDPNAPALKTEVIGGQLVHDMRPKPAPLPGGRYSDVELGVRYDDIRKAAEEVLHPSMWLAVRRAAREMAIERNRAESKRGDVSGRSACHRPLFET